MSLLNPLITVVVPCYNQALFLDEALESVVNQTYKVWECIIVNDGSTDGTESIAMQWCEKDPRFRYVHKENGGLSSARNAGIVKSRGAFIFPVDCDDTIHHKALELVVCQIKKNAAVDLIYFDVRFTGLKNSVYKLPEYTYKKLLVQNCFIACSVFRKELWIASNGYDEQLKSLEDWDFWIRALDPASTVIKIPTVLYFYRQHDSGNLRSEFSQNPSFYWDLIDYVYNKNIILYKQYFQHPIEEFKGRMDAEAFSAKVKSTWFFKCYHKIKSVL